ncbi:hypothetical protein Godav_014379 [Gossypium davidsonii]|uniref:40S ribosomal protein S6 n=1 Tax=Gossypium davidsonii TaxID=34287 RepID=A0A7J8RL33_GOSDV|nr:hypothetical protein [Gossypium davidsonii]
MRVLALDVTRGTLMEILGTPRFRGYGRRNGERRRKSVRGCIVSHDLSVLNLVVVKKGENELPGLTDTEKTRMRGPKRASKIRKLFNLSKEDDVRKYVNSYRRKSGKVSFSFVIDGHKIVPNHSFLTLLKLSMHIALACFTCHTIANFSYGVKTGFALPFTHAWCMLEVGYWILGFGWNHIGLVKMMIS